MELTNTFSALTMDEMIDVEGGVDPATAWAVAKGVLKAAALFGGSALVVGGTVVAVGLVINAIVD